MKKEKKNLRLALALLAAFVLWTAALCFVDVQAIGPLGTSVGFAQLNRFVHGLTGVHMSLYTITDWLGLVPLGLAAGFGMLGLAQWVRRRHIQKVDADLLILGGFYAVVLAAFIFFELFAVNYRPVLIEGRLEISYPSSTTLLVLCVVPTAIMQLNARIKNGRLKRCAAAALALVAVCMVIGRLVSGVHWFTDIIGGLLLSMGLVLLYRFCAGAVNQ